MIINEFYKILVIFFSVFDDKTQKIRLKRYKNDTQMTGGIFNENGPQRQLAFAKRAARWHIDNILMVRGKKWRVKP